MYTLCVAASETSGRPCVAPSDEFGRGPTQVGSEVCACSCCTCKALPVLLVLLLVLLLPELLLVLLLVLLSHTVQAL